MAQSKADKLKASTQEHLDIDDITDNLVLLKNGWVALVMGTTAVNFDILSETEQDATIYAYGALLNSLTFPVQILIRSKKADITAYYQHLIEAEKNQPNPDLKTQIRKYREFVQATVQQKTILDKRFYIVIHFSPLELGVKGFKKKTDTTNKKSKIQLITDAKNTLYPKREHIIKQTARLGLFTKQLATQELIELFYDIYNPAPTGTQRVILNPEAYTTPLVEPDVETPTPAPEAAPQKVVVQPPARNEQMSAANPAPPPTLPVEASPIQNEQPIIMPKSQSVAPAQPVILPEAVQAAPAAENVSAPKPTVGSGGIVTNANSSQQDALRGLQDAIKRANQMAGRDINK